MSMAPAATGKLQSLHPLGAAVLTSALATAASTLLPDEYAASGVGMVFLLATYVLALRGDQPADHVGLSFGGLLDPAPISWRRLSEASLRALLVAVATMLVIVPATWVGFLIWNTPTGAFNLDRALQLGPQHFPSKALLDLAAGHLLVVALPEEVFFRGYLQSRLDEKWKGRISLLGVPVGWSLVITSVIFALGHLATTPQPARLAVFFPSLLFGWLRLRTGGVGASILVHALSNLLIIVLEGGYSGG